MVAKRISPNICGHLDRKHCAKGRCSQCYEKYRRRNGDLAHEAYKEKQRERYAKGSGADILRKCYLKRKFGITQKQFERMVEQSNGLCYICNRAETATCLGKIKKISIDHDHKTGGVRGLLCQACNQMIGNSRDDPETLRSAAAYLEGSHLCQSLELT